MVGGREVLCSAMTLEMVVAEAREVDGLVGGPGWGPDGGARCQGSLCVDEGPVTPPKSACQETGGEAGIPELWVLGRQLSRPPPMLQAVLDSDTRDHLRNLPELFGLESDALFFPPRWFSQAARTLNWPSCGETNPSR